LSSPAVRPPETVPMSVAPYKHWAILVALVTLLVGLITNSLHSPLSMATVIIAAAVIVVGLVPAIQWILYAAADRPRFPLMGLAGAYYAVFYGFSVFFVDILWHDYYRQLVFYQQPAPIYIDEYSMLATLAGISFMIGAYQVTKSRLVSNFPSMKIQTNVDWSAVRVLSWILAAAFLIYQLVPSLSKIPTLGSFMVPAGNVGIIVLYAMARLKKLTRVEAVLLVLVVFPILLMSWIAQSFMTPIMIFATVIIFTEAWLKERLPWKSIVALPVLFLLIYPVTGEIRAKVWAPGNSLGVVEKASLSAKTLLNFYGFELGEKNNYESNPPGSKASFVGVTTRISHQLILARIIQSTPDQVPYWGGETYAPLLSKLIPRVLWQEKPQERSGNEFGRRYHFLLPTEFNMSVNIPWMPELFANFGWVGMITGMALIGVLMCLLEAFFVSPRGGYLEGAVGVAIVSPLFMHESNFSLMVGNIPLIALSVWVFYRLGLLILSLVRP